MRTRAAAVCVLAIACLAGTAGTASASSFFSLDGTSTIPASGNASLYPSTITVPGTTTGLVTDIDVGITGVTHANLMDLGAVLVSPGGKAFEPFDAIDGGSVSNINVTFNDQASGLAPQGGTLATGTYKPTVRIFGLSESYPAPGPGLAYANPGPAGGGTATLDGTFGGFAASGTWKLYVVDFDGATGGGSIAQWDMLITTAAPDASLTPFTHAFPVTDPAAGPTSARTFTLTNTGATPLHLDAASIGGTAPGDFAITEDLCASQTLAPSATCTANVAFDPTSVGNKDAQLRIGVEDVGTLTSELSGTGQAPVITLPPPPSSQTAPGPAATGQRAAALAKCKKKKGAARKKCKKRANKLPL
jgi:hypothetical protein